MAKTLTLRLNDDQEASLIKLINSMNERTASKAIIKAIEDQPKLSLIAEGLSQRILKDKEEIERLNSIIENARISALAFAEALSQDDLLSKS